MISSIQVKAAGAPGNSGGRVPDERVALMDSLPFIAVHVACLAVFWTGASWFAVGLCVAFYFLRMFGITGGYHRYFSHRSYKTSRFFQFALGFLGATSAQQGPLWWAAHHRHHHKYSDTPEDIHSPGLRGLWWAHVGWIVCRKYMKTNVEAVRDLAKFPELRFLDRWHMLVPSALGVGVFGLGLAVERFVPGLHTTAMQTLVWGFFVSTVFLYHGTFCINSLAHMIGRRRFETSDESRNSMLLALITMGEGWHNNHHRFPSAERQGYYWWEIDMTHYILAAFSRIGVVWDLHRAPDEIYDEVRLAA